MDPSTVRPAEREVRSAAHRRRARLVGALCVAAAALVAPPWAGAVHVPDDCGQRVIGEWSSDGRVGQGYPLACYRAALRSLPEDVLQYSSADEEIRRALALARQARSEQASTTRTETGASRTAGTAAALPAPAVPATARSPALPYPVPVLAAVALALLGVAAAGLLTATRRRARG